MACQIMDYYADDDQIIATINEDHGSPHILFLMNTVNIATVRNTMEKRKIIIALSTTSMKRCGHTVCTPRR